ncbi:MAG: putative tRNA sulfurtransferase [Mycoplasmataceae bacterium]|nr:MAG: putative tRNA sulfurtransferase [Mycoplasmataceae bacterium]
MKKYLIIRFGELFLKKKNRSLFINRLVDNLKNSFQKNNLKLVKIERYFDQLFIDAENLDIEESNCIESILKNTFGISSYYTGYLSNKGIIKEIEFFFENMDKFLEIDFTKFRLTFKRRDKSFPIKSIDLQKKFGGLVAKKFNLNISLEEYEKNIEISIYKDFAIFLLKRVKCLEGLPIGSSGKALILFSGGIDSSVAAYNLMKRGLEVEFLHFYVNEQNDKSKIFSLIKKLKKFNNHKGNLYLVNTKNILREISHIEIDSYRIIILKRMFLRFAEKLANKNKIELIANGDSLGQVASQTIESMHTIYSSINSKLIVSPLITRDKQEIINEAKKIDVYDLSISQYEDCCFVFQPRNPIIKPSIKQAEYLEEKILWREIFDETNIELNQI